MSALYGSCPKVAVCLAAFNGVRWLPEQLDSILTQTHVTVTVFVSVDVSSDNTQAWIDQAAAHDSRVVVLSHGEHFGGAAPNFFRLLADTDFSEFDYVSFVDQDDIWLPDKLRRAHETLLKTEADAYSSNVMAFWPDGRKALIEKSQDQVQWDFLFEAAGPGCTYVMCKKLACAIQALVKNRRVEIQQVGLHDWFAYAFARANGYRWVIDDYPGMLYRQHEKNQVGVNKGWRALMHRARKICSGWGLSQSALIADLVGLGNDPFVKRWSDGSRIGMLWLASHAGQCRRRLRDKCLFALSCLVLAIIGKRQP
jgi:rhamnosyltransferase